MTRMLVEQDEVLFMAPRSAPAAQYRRAKISKRQEGAAAFRRDRRDPLERSGHFPVTMGWQPSYQIEGAILGRYTVSAHPAAKIGILYQNDDSGKDYLKGSRPDLAMPPSRSWPKFPTS